MSLSGYLKFNIFIYVVLYVNPWVLLCFNSLEHGLVFKGTLVHELDVKSVAFNRCYNIYHRSHHVRNFFSLIISVFHYEVQGCHSFMPFVLFKVIVSL